MTGELERRWEAALRELRQAEDSYQRAILSESPAPTIPPELRRGFEQVGRDLPGLWSQGYFTAAQKKALLRCLIDKVVIRRITPTRSRRGSFGKAETRPPLRSPSR